MRHRSPHTVLKMPDKEGEWFFRFLNRVFLVRFLLDLFLKFVLFFTIVF